VEELGLEIKIARIRCGLSQHQLGILIGEPSYNVSRYERGVVTPGTEVLGKIKVALGFVWPPAQAASDASP
jgi:transcriptional regulator with XRE-family HTH domain